jgi:aldose 1-epimerase
MTELQLRAGDTEATFLPDLGMVGISLRHAGTEILALPGGLDAYRGGHVVGLPLLAPWANRLSGWTYEIDGVTVDLERSDLDLHDDGKGLPIHGTMTAQPGWEVEATTPTTARVRFDYGARPDLLQAFPFPHELALDLQLEEGRLDVATTVRPTGDRRVPVSFGWHPYFVLPGSRADTRLRLPACDHHVLDDRGLPTRRTDAQPADNRPLGDRAFDDLFTLTAERRLAFESDQRAVAVDLGEGYRFFQVYSPAGAEFGCLEPMTAPVNALVSGDCALVDPGEQFTARFSVEVSA